MLLILLAAATQAAFENSASFKDCRTGINETFVDYAMPIYNLIEYSDNYLILWEVYGVLKEMRWLLMQMWLMIIMLLYLNIKKVLLIILKANGTKNGVKIAVPLKYMSNFWMSLETLLINCKIELSLNWIENCTYYCW